MPPLLQSLLSIAPFAILLLMVATGPILYPHFWHRYYAAIASLGCALVMGFYGWVLGRWEVPVETCAEYLQFITLIGALYVTTGGIQIRLSTVATPGKNVLLLWTGAVLANLIGTTGASMLLIRPYMAFNRGRLSAYHVVFFIFIVSNIGGALTPIGDPPLFLGFLKGVPFFWTLRYGVLPWAFAIALLSAAFYWLDLQNPARGAAPLPGGSAVSLRGIRHLALLAAIISAVFIDPHLFFWVPALSYHGHQISYVRELIFVAIGLYAYQTADREVLRENNFSLEPLREVAFLFIGIFGTMAPALALVDNFARSPLGQQWLTVHTLYWGTGLLSSILDNAPTYLNFLAAGMAARGGDVQNFSSVGVYAAQYVTYLQATSLAAVFFGAMTYVGNGPNFMVRAIAEKGGVKMPNFGAYIGRYALFYLLPVLAMVWVLFFFRG